MSAKKKAAAKKTARRPVAKKKAAKRKSPVKKAPAKKASAKKKARGKIVEAEKRYKMIQDAAYYLAEKSDFSGNTADYWIQAEKQIDAQLKSK